MTGYYRMHRGWQSHEIFRGEKFSRRDAWIWLIENAAWKESKIDLEGKTVTIEVGQLCHSFRHIAEAWKWSVGTVQRFLTRLKTDTMIDTRTERGRLIITVCNYKRYQLKPEAPDTRSDTVNDTGAIRERYKGEEGKNTNIDISKKVDQLLSTLGASKRPTAQRPNYDDPKERKARWQQKIMDEIRRTLSPEQAGLIIASYSSGEREGKQYFEMVDQRLKARRSQTEAA